MNGSAQAIVMWVRIRGFILALLIMTIAEVASTKGALTTVAKDGIADSIEGLERSLSLVFDQKDPADEKAACKKTGGVLKHSVLDQISKGISDAAEFGSAAREEPRFARAPWNYPLLS